LTTIAFGPIRGLLPLTGTVARPPPRLDPRPGRPTPRRCKPPLRWRCAKSDRRLVEAGWPGPCEFRLICDLVS
jgi:hypothetical protein